jgi:phosphoribosylformylglycinamidine synthase subunit PurQ / glutaminase
MQGVRAMKAAVVTFPGSNCDRDLAVAFEAAGARVERVWHKDTALPAGIDIVGLPGGFSFGDYLRCGAIAARSPVFAAVVDFAARGGHVLGICNGFQVLCEAGLLPGALMRNASLRFVCRPVRLRVETADSPFTNQWSRGAEVTIPVAHHDGNYAVAPNMLARLQGEDRIAFSYVDNPNGSMADIAGVLSENRRVLGMMPHPERAIDQAQGGADGSVLFRSLMAALVTA